MPYFVTVSRKWDNPEIFSSVNGDGISLTIKLDDFKEALKNEIGSVAFVFTLSTLSERIDEAFNNIVKGIKEESIKVVG